MREGVEEEVAARLPGGIRQVAAGGRVDRLPQEGQRGAEEERRPGCRRAPRTGVQRGARRARTRGGCAIRRAADPPARRPGRCRRRGVARSGVVRATAPPSGRSPRPTFGAGRSRGRARAASRAPSPPCAGRGRCGAGRPRAARRDAPPPASPRRRDSAPRACSPRSRRPVPTLYVPPASLAAAREQCTDDVCHVDEVALLLAVAEDHHAVSGGAARSMKIATTPPSSFGSCRGPKTLPSLVVTWLVPCRRFQVARYSSPASFEAPYGASGSRGSSSRAGRGHSP